MFGKGSGGGGDAFGKARNNGGHYQDDDDDLYMNFNASEEKKRHKRGTNVNPRVDLKIADCVAPLQKINPPFSQVLRAAGTSHAKLAKWRGFGKHGICGAYSAGFCDFKGCKSAHLIDNELPAGYIKHYCNVIKPGVEKLVYGRNDGDGGERAFKKRRHQ